MPRKSQADRLEEYRSKIEHSIRWRQNEGYTATWRRMIEAYKGEQMPEGWEGDRSIVNMSFAVANIVVASVSTQYPKFTVKATKMGFDDQATIAEAVLNYLWQHYEFQDDFQQAVTDDVHIGHGWLKVGWRYHEEDVEPGEEVDVDQAALGAANTVVDQMALGDIEGAGALPTPEELERQLGSPTAEVTVDDPFCERISPFDMVVDPESTGVRDLRWLAHRTVRHLEEVREDKAYSARARNRVEADAAVWDPDMDEPLGDEDLGGDVERVTVWEFYDLVKGEWCCFAQSGDTFLRKPEAMPYGFDNPFVMFRNHDVPDHFYPVGDLEMMEPLQEELNKTRTQAIDARKQYVRKFIAREGALDERARNALTSDVDGEIVLIADDQVPLDQVVIHAPFLTFDPSIFNAHGQTISQDLQVVTGLSDYQFGQMPDTRRLATEAMAVQGSTNARASYQLSKVERSLARVGKRLLQLAQQFVDGTRVARITGAEGDLLFAYSADDIEGEYDFAVEAGSTQPNNDMLRRQEAMSLYNTLAPLFGTVIDPVEATRHLLQNGFDIKNVDRFFLKQPMGVPGAPTPPGGAPPGMEGGPPGVGPAPPGGPPLPAGPPPEPGQENMRFAMAGMA